MKAMKIVFLELKNPIIQDAIARCPQVSVVEARNLTEGCEILMRDEAEGMIAGIDETTKEVVNVCRKKIPLKEKYFSSAFLLEKGEKRLIIADAGVCKNPDAELLTCIVRQTYETANKLLEEKPRIAMLSFSTFGSGGEDETITKSRKVIENIRKKYPEIIIDGEMQLDTAINIEVAKKKAPKSLVAGKANVLICPDLNSGNILYKGLEHLGGWTVAGPILQGFIKNISDVSRGSTTEDVELIIKTMEKLK